MSGRRVDVARVEKSDADWKKELNAQEQSMIKDLINKLMEEATSEAADSGDPQGLLGTGTIGGSHTGIITKSLHRSPHRSPAKGKEERLVRDVLSISLGVFFDIFCLFF